MESLVPRFLYRTYSEKSNGVNSPTYLAPQITTHNPPLETIEIKGLSFDASPGAIMPLKQQLIVAFQRKPSERNPFIFFTDSLPQVIIHALWRRGDAPDSRIYIMCLDLKAARNAAGDAVKFRLAREVTQELSIKLTDAHVFKPLDFQDVYITSDTIFPGPGSSLAPFSALLEQGLFTCVPEFAAIDEVTLGVARPISHLREFWVQTEIDLPEQDLNLAAKLAAIFEPVLISDRDSLVPMHVFAWFLVMKDQGLELPGLKQWLHRHATLKLNYAQTTFPAPPTPLKEVERFNAVMGGMNKWYIETNGMKDLNARLSTESVKARKNGFKGKRAERNKIRNEAAEVEKADRRKRRAARGLPPWVPRKKKTKKKATS